MHLRRSFGAAVALVLAAAVGSCGGKSKQEQGGGPPPASGTGSGEVGQPPLVAPQPGVKTVCPALAGEYRLMFKTSCGSTGWGWVNIEQNGCDITANLKQLALVKGRLEGDTASIALTYNFPCAGSGSGTLTASGRIVSASFSGGATGTELRCCSPMNGTFTLTKQ